MCDIPDFLSERTIGGTELPTEFYMEFRNVVLDVVSLIQDTNKGEEIRFEVVGVNKIIPQEGTDMSYPSTRKKSRDSTLIIIPMGENGCFVQIFRDTNLSGVVIFVPHNQFIVVTEKTCYDIGYGIHEREDGCRNDGGLAEGILEIEVCFDDNMDRKMRGREQKKDHKHCVTAFWMKKHYGMKAVIGTLSKKKREANHSK